MIVEYIVEEIQPSTGQWQWKVKADFDTNGFRHPLFGVWNSPEDAGWAAILTGNELAAWYWQQQQLSLF